MLNLKPVQPAHPKGQGQPADLAVQLDVATENLVGRACGRVLSDNWTAAKATDGLALRGAWITAAGSAAANGTAVAAGGGYAATGVALGWGAAASQSQATNAVAQVTNYPRAETVTAVEVWSTDATPLRVELGNLTASKTMAAGDTLSFAAGAITSALA